MAYGALCLAAFTLAIFSYWSFYPYNPLTVTNAPVPIRPISLASGVDTTVIATTKVCKYTNAIPIVVRSIVGEGSVLMTPAYSGAVRTTGCTTLQQAIILPQFTPPGTYHVHWRVNYQVNPIRSVVVQYDSETFKVTKPGSL